MQRPPRHRLHDNLPVARAGPARGGPLSNLSLIPAIVGISMSFAGFAGLFLALRPKDSEWQRDEIGQINAIVGYAFTALFSGLFVVPLASLIGASSAIRVMSGFALVVAFYQH